MKLLFFILSIVLAFSCHPTKKSSYSIAPQDADSLRIYDSTNFFKIIEIDSLENVYVILAEKGLLKYKIVSFKEYTTCSHEIKVGQNYHLQLFSVFPPNYLSKDRVSTVRYGKIKVPLGGGKDVIWDIFSTKNLKSLCLQ